MSSPLLELDHVTKRFGRVVIAEDLSFAVGAGIVMVPEGRRLFGSLTVEENLQVGATYARKGPWTIERVYELFG